MVRIAKWAGLDQATSRKLASHRMQHGDIKRLARRKRGQQTWKAGGQHRFAGTWRADHQKIVPAGSGNLENAPGCFLTFQIGHVGRVMRWQQQFRPRLRQKLAATKMRE